MNDKTEVKELDKSLQRKSPDIVYQEKVKRVQKVKSTTVLKTDSDEKPTTLKAKSMRERGAGPSYQDVYAVTHSCKTRTTVAGVGRRLVGPKKLGR